MKHSCWMFSLLLAMGLASCAPTTSREPRNLSDLKNEIESYVTDGAYQRDLEQASAPAKNWIGTRARTPHGKLAVVFDIDETALSNLIHMQEADWGYQPAIWSAWVAEGKAPAIAPVLEIYQIARQRDVTVFFITGRRASEKEATARNLRAEGMGNYARLVVRGDRDRTSASDFKTAERRRITGEGFTIIANIGDQQSDLDGGYAEKIFKLPNPFYKIP